MQWFRHGSLFWIAPWKSQSASLHFCICDVLEISWGVAIKKNPPLQFWGKGLLIVIITRDDPWVAVQEHITQWHIWAHFSISDGFCTTAQLCRTEYITSDLRWAVKRPTWHHPLLDSIFSDFLWLSKFTQLSKPFSMLLHCALIFIFWRFVPKRTM